MRLEVFQLFPLGRFISIQRILATGGIGEQFVGLDARCVERHEHARARHVFREVANAVAVQHLYDFVNGVSGAGAHDAGGAVDILV